jgi:hypothetical protein
VGWRHSHSARKAAWMLDFRRFDFSSCPQSCPLRSIMVATFSLRARTFMAEGLPRLLHFARLFEGDPLSLLALRGAGSGM